MFSVGLVLGLVEALRLVEAEARWRRWWDTMHVVWAPSRLEEEEMNRAVVIVAGAALGARDRRGMPWFQEKGLQCELDRRRLRVGVTMSVDIVTGMEML
jgi:hypothetical protein